MSVAAEAYYREIMGGDGELPPILSGEPFALIEPGQRIPLQRPNLANEKIFTDNYHNVITDVGTFVQQRLVGSSQVSKSATVSTVSSTSHINSTVERLKPKSLRAGHLRDCAVEAVTPDEIEEKLISRALARRADADIWLQRERCALLVVSAELYAGRVLGRTAMLSMVAADAKHGVHRVAAILYNKNELLAQSGLWQSEATKTYIDHWGAAQPVIQAVRRGKSSKGNGTSSY